MWVAATREEAEPLLTPACVRGSPWMPHLNTDALLEPGGRVWCGQCCDMTMPLRSICCNTLLVTICCLTPGRLCDTEG